MNIIEKKDQIDYRKILEFVEEYCNASLSEDDNYKQILETEAQNAFDELKKFALRCKSEFMLESSTFSPLLDVSKKKVRRNMWLQLRYGGYEDNPVSISIFAEEEDNYPKFRVCLDIKDGVAIDIMDKYHTHLDIPLTNNLSYGYKSNEWGIPLLLTDSVENIKGRISSGDIRKVQIYRNIETAPEKTNVLYDDELMNAVKQLIPYYQHVLGKKEELKEALEQMNLSNVGETGSINRNKYDHNTILYGPPGTGKTYNSATYAVAICDGKNIEELNDYEEVMERYNELKRAGRIAFTTFHQSYGYEEFIEGIKPVMGDNNDIGYTIEPGVFKKFCDKARLVSVTDNNSKIIKDNPRIWGMLLDGTGKSELKKNCYANNVVRLGFTEVSDESIEAGYDSNEKGKTMVNYFKNEVEVGDIIVVVGNTSKSIDGIGIVTGDYVYDNSENDYKRKRDVKWLLKDTEQSMVEYLNAKGRQKFGRNSIFDFDYIGLDSISEILEQNGVENTLTVTKENKPFVFIIDEINRGNISKIFGELITLIENTKREGMPEAVSAILPYSHEEFSVPSNVYILGTMNTADRSIQMMDTALRRRFQFVEMMPSVDVLRDLGIDDVDFGGITLNIPRMLETINNRIAYLFDREHTIGHAFFTSLKYDRTIDRLATIFEKSVIPLLQEYFYEDYQKIQLVLGDNAKEDDSTKFIINKPANPTALFMGSVEDYLDEKEEIYTINHNAFKNIMAYKNIANNL